MIHIGLLPRGFLSNPYQDPWENGSPMLGMETGADGAYKWVLCPHCDEFGAEYFGRAERLPCSCLDGRDDKHYNDADPRLLRAYTVATATPFAEGEVHGYAPALEKPTRREAVIKHQGPIARTNPCQGRCVSVAQLWREETPPEAHTDTEDVETVCAACGAAVCTECGIQPALATGTLCRVCEPQVSLHEYQARGLLNDMAAQLSHRNKLPVRTVHAALNREVGVRSRAQADIRAIAAALGTMEQWLEQPDTVPIALRTPVGDELALLTVPEARNELAGLVPALGAAVRESIPLVQMTINNMIGAVSRQSATAEQLQEAIKLARGWISNPSSYPGPRARRIQLGAMRTETVRPQPANVFESPAVVPGKQGPPESGPVARVTVRLSAAADESVPDLTQFTDVTWPSVLEATARRSRVAWALINQSARPVRVEAGAIVLGFSNAILLDSFEGTRADALLDALHEVVGCRFKLEAGAPNEGQSE